MLSREQEENMPTQADYRNMAEECRKKSTLPDASPEWAVLAAKWEGLSEIKGEPPGVITVEEVDIKEINARRT
jgi:hypothetical protein